MFEAMTRRLTLEEHDRRLLLLMGALVAILFCAYTIAKVLRDALFIAEFGALALPYAYIGVAMAATGFVWLESRVALRFQRVGATRFNQYAAIGFSLAAAAILPFARHWTTAVFYIWAGSQAMMLLPHFWALTLDVWDSRRARRVVPLLGGCGLIGGLLGGAFAGWATPIVKSAGLMWTLSGLLIAAHLLTRVIERHRARRPRPIVVSRTVSNWKIVRRSSYIKVLVAALALSVIVSTLVDFQFKVFIQRVYPDPQALTQFLGRFYVGLNALALVFQFSVGGWLLYRLGLGRSTGLQPATAILFVSSLVLGAGWWIIVAMRWIQGVVFQTLGKSSAEIYFMAVRPHERRRIKPAVDTLVDRWSDAAVGILLISLLGVVSANGMVVPILTAIVITVWVVLLLFLNRAYGRAFGQTLSSHWLEPDVAEEAMRMPSARKALSQGLRADDEARIVLALKLSEQSEDREIARAVRGCLRHPSLSVRAAAVEAMEATRLRDEEGLILGFLEEPHEGLRRAAVRYLIAGGPQAASLARRWLNGGDTTLRRHAVDALFDRPSAGRAALTLEWIDSRLASGAREDHLVVARALGAMTVNAPVQRWQALLTDPDIEVRRVALLSAARRPSVELVEVLLPLLLLPELSYEARRAIAAIGAPALPCLERLLGGERGPRAQALSARILARIASPGAVGALVTIVKSSDQRLRDIGLQALSHVRVETDKPVLPRSVAHRLFLRELREYREFVGPSLSLAEDASPEVRLLGETFRESAESALQRAMWALGCWYEPKPLFGAFERLKAREASAAAPALEYLGHVLPHRVFLHMSRIFEPGPSRDSEAGMGDGKPLADSIRMAWRSEDGWLRACAVRASRHATALDVRLFATGEVHPLVQAELAALAASGAAPHELPPGSGPTPPQGAAC
jgi:ATP:ADP antiporter, AAA family